MPVGVWPPSSLDDVISGRDLIIHDGFLGWMVQDNIGAGGGRRGWREAGKRDNRVTSRDCQLIAKSSEIKNNMM